MKYTDETVKKFLDFIEKEKTLKEVCLEMDMNEYKVLDLVSYIRSKGINIAMQNTADENIYMVNMGDYEFVEKNVYNFQTNENNEFKFIVIADTRLGSKSQQLSILNDIYLKGHEMGYDNVILCGNISAGLYPLTKVYAETNFINDTQGQIDYIVSHYPKVDGMKTYFITGKLDDIHLTKQKINIGKRIADLRDDMIYLGENSCDLVIDNMVMQLFSSQLSKTYTVSYRTQQQAVSFRSEDKPDVMLYGGLLQCEQFTYRGIKILSIPSVCATTKEMAEKRYSNTIGAWYVTVSTNNKKGTLESINAFSSLYYQTNKDDYMNAKVLKDPDKVKKLVK
jgi:hypothetical protein